MVYAENYSKGRLMQRGVDEFIGLCKGLVADDRVNEQEARFILNWIQGNASICDVFPVNQIYPKLAAMLADNVWTEEEEQELIALIRAVTGEQGQCGGANMSTGLIFDENPPRLEYEGEEYCITGDFAFGPRKEVAAFIESLGGNVSDSVHKLTPCILIVGCKGSDAWLHSTHGRKIQKALKARAEGCPVHIISESYWIEDSMRVEKERLRVAERTANTGRQYRDILNGILPEDE